MPFHGSLPTIGVVGVLFLTAGVQKGLRPSLGQAQTDGDVAQAPVAFGPFGLTTRVVVQLGHEALGGSQARKARFTPGQNTFPAVPIKNVEPKVLVAVPEP